MSAATDRPQLRFLGQRLARARHFGYPVEGDVRSHAQVLGAAGMEAGDPVVRFRSAGMERTASIAPRSVCRIGRGPENDIVLTSADTSRAHAMIRREASGLCFLSDSGSRNGTRLNGRAIVAPVALKDGDTIVIGGETLAFQQAAAPVAVTETSAEATQIVLSSSFVTVLVADIRDYTKLARDLGEARVSQLLSEFFGAVGTLLSERRCWHQKYAGDCVMGLWVHDRPEVDRATFAAILDLVLAMQALAAPLQGRFGLGKPVSFGVGINSGSASVGNLGSAAAADFTAVGDAVNKAFRLEAATRSMGADILIGKSSIDSLCPPAMLPPELERIEVALKGYDAPEAAFRLQLEDVHLLAEALSGDGNAGQAAAVPRRGGLVA